MIATGVTGIVLAGGRSARFGGDKLAAIVGGEPLLHRPIRAVGEVVTEAVVVIAPDAPEPSLPDGVGVPITVARDQVAGRGPLAGLAAGLAVATSPHALLVAGDQPFVRPDVLRELLAGLRDPGDPAAVDVVALGDGDSLWPFPVALRVATVQPAVAAAVDGHDLRLFTLFRRLRVGRVPEERWRTLDPDGRSLRDVDTVDDLPRP